LPLGSLLRQLYASAGVLFHPSAIVGPSERESQNNLMLRRVLPLYFGAFSARNVWTSSRLISVIFRFLSSGYLFERPTGNGRDGPWRDAQGRGPCLRPSATRRCALHEFPSADTRPKNTRMRLIFSVYGPPACALLGRPFRAKCFEPAIPGVEQGDCQPRRIAD
jgi:hypothetical protein